MALRIEAVDYTNPQQAQEFVYLLNEYALDPMGGGKPLSDFVTQNLALEMSKRDYAFSFICYVDDKPAGLINCIESFSSFACKPLVNIHDIVVLRDYRGLGISQKLLAKAEDVAREKGCCKLTLEVLSGNEVAKNAYRKHGFSGYELDPQKGSALFWQKNL